MTPLHQAFLAGYLHKSAGDARDIGTAVGGVGGLGLGLLGGHLVRKIQDEESETPAWLPYLLGGALGTRLGMTGGRHIGASIDRAGHTAVDLDRERILRQLRRFQEREERNSQPPSRPRNSKPFKRPKPPAKGTLV